MRIRNREQMYLPALSILALVFFMLVVIGISTYRNLNREESKAMAALHRQGISLLNALEAGARTGVAFGIGKKGLENLFRESAKSEDVSYIYLEDADGAIVGASDMTWVGKVPPLRPEPAAGQAVATRIRAVTPDLRLYEIAKLLLPGDEKASPENRRNVTGSAGGPAVLVLGLEMTEFEKAREADLHHALIMAAILIALGLAALFFIGVIQKYYFVDRSLRQTRDYTRQVVDNMANGLLSIDLKGAVISYNALALSLLDLKEDEIGGLDLKEVMDFDAMGISETLETRHPVLDRETLYQRKSGRVIPLSLSVTPICTEKDTCTGAVILLRDLREIRQLQEKVRRSEKLAAIGELAAGVAHEIRNPLSSIKGFAQFLRHSLKDRPEEWTYADVMVREVDRINRVVTDLLIYSRPVSIDRSLTDISEVIHHTVRLVKADAESRKISIDIKISAGIGSVWVDGNQITQALLNLLINSIQAMPDGGKMEIGAERNASADRLEIWVEDDGPGIPAANQSKILDPFFTTRDKGTGLGLAIVHKIVENHQGEIHIQSPVANKSKGTRITLQLTASAFAAQPIQG